MKAPAETCLLYTSICQNNTIFGTKFVDVPQVDGVPLVADMSSMICSEPVDVSKYGVIYFGVQKNIAPAGMAVAIVREDLLGKAAKGLTPDKIPTMMNYTTLLNADSMYNTPPCWCIYMTGLVMNYLENEVGGLENMQKINTAKAKVLYDYLDGQDFYKNPVEKKYRSMMNVTFTSPDAVSYTHLSWDAPLWQFSAPPLVSTVSMPRAAAAR